jgi:hypothetical protein
LLFAGWFGIVAIFDPTTAPATDQAPFGAPILASSIKQRNTSTKAIRSKIKSGDSTPNKFNADRQTKSISLGSLSARP